VDKLLEVRGTVTVTDRWYRHKTRGEGKGKKRKKRKTLLSSCLVHRAQREKKATTGMKKENVKKEEKRYMPLSSSNTVRGDWNDREKKGIEMAQTRWVGYHNCRHVLLGTTREKKRSKLSG
jgi:hypothetical protein